MTQEESERLILAVSLQSSPGGVSQEDLERIVEEFAQHKTRANLWERVLDGELEAKWDASRGKVSFHAVPEDEVAIRKRVLAASES